MLFIAENLKSLRKEKNLTQEEAAEMLGVSPQSVSKWERGDTYPDITLLPALANLYKTSVDAIIGMDKINDNQAKTAIYEKSHSHFRNNNYAAAAEVLSEALKIFPNDEGFISELAMALALEGNEDNLNRAVALCERILSSSAGSKVHHTTRAALCFIYLKSGDQEKAAAAAKNLPHIRECRETILMQISQEADINDIDAYLKFIAVGDDDQQDIITIDFGRNMLSLCYDYDLTGKIESLRTEMNAPHTDEGHRKLPVIRVRDNFQLKPNQVRVRYYTDYLINKEYSDYNEAVNEIIQVLKNKIKHVNPNSI